MKVTSYGILQFQGFGFNLSQLSLPLGVQIMRQFSLRTLFVCVLGVGIMLPSLINAWREWKAEKERRAKEDLNRLIVELERRREKFGGGRKRLNVRNQDLQQLLKEHCQQRIPAESPKTADAFDVVHAAKTLIPYT